MRLYAAPLEGLTSFSWRKAHKEVFGGADKYFAPFFSPTHNYELNTKEYRDLTQNESDLVPQILVSKVELAVWSFGILREMGYNEVNINFGCPSGTVVAKGKGSGALREPDKLDELLDGIFSGAGDMKLSVKTRVGTHDSDNWGRILEIYEKYPITELIVHPRVQKQFYKGDADRELFKESMKSCSIPIVYNGDVNTPDDEAFSYGCDVMCGRGLIARPSLLREARGGRAATNEELRRFHDMVLESYSTYMPGDTALLHRMKEFWHYFNANYDVEDRLLKKLLKSKHLPEYRAAAHDIMNSELNK